MAYADSQRPVTTALARRMAATMVHRGPDSEGVFTSAGVGLAARRMAINDLAGGDQPISNEDGTITVVCNGEIYNFVELRQRLIASGHRFHSGSDVEVIAHLYEDHGLECVGHLRGMFAFALWDERRRRLMLARDRLGIKPLHYALLPDRILFGSEIKSILAAGEVERRLEVAALRDLFAFGFPLGSRSFFAGVQHLLPGHFLLYERGVAAVRQHWEITFPARGTAGPRRRAEEWAEALREALRESVRLHVRADTPVGAWLSPGIDSSSVVSLMRSFVPVPISTFTLAFADPDHDETAGQRLLDSFPGYDLINERAVCGDDDLRLLERAVWHQEEPFAIGLEIPRLLLAALAARRVKVVLTGEGADELLGGYPWHRLDRLLRPLACLPPAIRRLALVGGLVSSRWPRASRVLMAPAGIGEARYQAMIAPIHAADHEALFAPDTQQAARAAEAPLAHVRPPDGFERWHPFSQLQHYEIKTRLPDFILRHVDRASMAYGLEARVPFLDHEVVDLCASIPPELKMRGLTQKHILRRALRDDLPPAIARRPKRGLRAPAARWLRGPLPERARHLLSAEEIGRAGYFDARVVGDLLTRHRAGAADHGHQLLAVLTVQLWEAIFRRGDLTAVPPVAGAGTE